MTAVRIKSPYITAHRTSKRRTTQFYPAILAWAPSNFGVKSTSRHKHTRTCRPTDLRLLIANCLRREQRAKSQRRGPHKQATQPSIPPGTWKRTNKERSLTFNHLRRLTKACSECGQQVVLTTQQTRGRTSSGDGHRAIARILTTRQTIQQDKTDKSNDGKTMKSTRTHISHHCCQRQRLARQEQLAQQWRLA